VIQVETQQHAGHASYSTRVPVGAGPDRTPWSAAIALSVGAPCRGNL
jgi:hypothetical protein